MFNLAGETNIHHGATAVAEKQQAAPEFVPRIRKVQRSPAEELAARAKTHGTTVCVPDSLAAILLMCKRSVDVVADGIKFRFQNKSYHFYSPDSVVCHPSNVGKPCTFVFNRHDLSVIYCLDQQGRFIEAVPLATHPDMFDKQMEVVLRETRRVTAHIHEALKNDHRIDTARAAQRAIENKDRMRFANDFPAPARSEDTASIESADRLHDAVRGVADHRKDLADLRVRMTARQDACPVTPDDRLAAYREEEEGRSDDRVSIEEITEIFKQEEA